MASANEDVEMRDVEDVEDEEDEEDAVADELGKWSQGLESFSHLTSNRQERRRRGGRV